MSLNLEDLKEQAYECFEKGDFQSALNFLVSISTQHGSNAELSNDIAVVLHKLGRTEEALRKFREAQALSDSGPSMIVDNLLDILEQQLKVCDLHNRKHDKTHTVVGNAALSDGNNDFTEEVLNQALTLWQKDSAIQLHRALAALSDDEWYQVLNDSVKGKLFEGHILPGFIEEETQRVFVGSAGVPALQEATNFIRVVLRYARLHGIPLDDKTRALDFGCGWGRFTRFMLKYIHPDNLYGLEVNSGMVEHCRKSFGMANFLKVESFPPCDLRDNLIDLTFGYSVFSHLAPDCADAWINEFARIMRPNSLILMTTQGRTFIEYCRKIRESGDRSNDWFISLSNSFVDVEQSYKAYDAGKFLHTGHGQYGGTYGESIIPQGYIQRHWQKYFDLVDFIDDRAFLPQALFVLKRKSNSYGY
jgi:SAM-dependent methyltransferase